MIAENRSNGQSEHCPSVGCRWGSCVLRHLSATWNRGSQNNQTSSELTLRSLIAPWRQYAAIHKECMKMHENAASLQEGQALRLCIRNFIAMDRENEAFCCVNKVLKLPAASYPRQDTLLSQVEDGFVTVLLVFVQMMYLSCIQSFSLSVSTSEQFCALWALWVAKHEASVGQEYIQVSPCMAMETCFCSIVDIGTCRHCELEWEKCGHLVAFHLGVSRERRRWSWWRWWVVRFNVVFELGLGFVSMLTYGP